MDHLLTIIVERVKTPTAKPNCDDHAGPPVYVSDPNGFPLPEGDTHVIALVCFG
jgi:hypothetical protein